jgi:2-polyprenyl-6-hydroxyphenyl methylase/3-demethylubiquinone-9 3-methyltransferase
MAGFGQVNKTIPFQGKRAFEVGCGNGATANFLSENGFEVSGIDTSLSGIELAQQAYPHVTFEVDSVYNDLAVRFGTFPLVVSLEVIEHCFYPVKFAATIFNLLEPGGIGIISTPYHGYWKNMALALTGKMDSHFTALWDGGHIKFFSEKTLRTLLSETGFQKISFQRVGRISIFAKSMVAIVEKW